MKIVPWRRPGSFLPFQADLDELFHRFWDDGENRLTSRLPEVFQNQLFPPVNVAETEDTFSVTIDCPGLTEEDIQVQAMGNTLVVSGERKWEEETKGKEFRRIESQFGRFERSILLPDNVRIEPERIDAVYKKGVLTIEVPKLEKTPTAKIPVTAG